MLSFYASRNLFDHDSQKLTQILPGQVFSGPGNGTSRAVIVLLLGGKKIGMNLLKRKLGLFC